MDKPGSLLLALAGSALLLLSNPLLAQKMYKWTDAEGNVQYTQTPPPSDTETTEIAPPPAPPTQPETTDGDEKAEKPPIPEGAEKEVSDKKREELEDAVARCQDAQEKRKIYQNARRVLVDGEAIALTDEERQRRLDNVQKVIDKYCK